MTVKKVCSIYYTYCELYYVGQ